MKVTENFIKATIKSFQIAASYVKLNPKRDFYSIIADPKGDKSYPMVAATFILLPSEKQEMNKRVTEFYNWVYTDGQDTAIYCVLLSK